MKPIFLIVFFAILLTGCRPGPGTTGHIRSVTKAVNHSRIVAAESNHSDWLTHGRNYAEDRYSDLSVINDKNVKRLGLAWSYDLGIQRGIEATPIVVDGIMYVTGPWSMVWAFDARTGNKLWEWDPKVDKKYAQYTCCDVVNRGVALYEGKVFVGTLDGRLVALDAATGHPIWSRVTVDQSKAYTITGAPRVVKGQVIIGNGGAEFGVRGYVSAYDVTYGSLLWRTYTVPGNPAEPFESAAMEEAAKTWSGEWWKYGGGGTAWDAMAYDPDLNLLYIGTGNGAPWSRLHRSDGEGDNLYLSSILALNPDDGELVWHYQTTPGDTWDYTATQPLILADLEIDGAKRQVIMQAPKNGFFYVLDRTDGSFISAAPYSDVSWATGIDQETGRPIIPEENYFEEAPADITPSIFGAHNWQPMAYNPHTGLVYIPAREHKLRFSQDENWEYQPGVWNSGTNQQELSPPKGILQAWDPVAQKEVWRKAMKHHWNGGVLTTGGNLLFQGNGEGNLVVYDARDGQVLLEKFLGTGIIGTPVTYSVNRTQYVTLVAGWGGAGGLYWPPAGEAAQYQQRGRIFTFALDAETSMPELAKLPPINPPTVDLPLTDDQLAAGVQLDHANCARCHGFGAISNTAVPDLRRAGEEVHEQFEFIVYGARLAQGMPNFSDLLSREEVQNIHAYVVSEAIKASATN